MDDFMDLIQWIGGEPFAVGLHRKKILVGGFEKLSDLEREKIILNLVNNEFYETLPADFPE